MQTKKQHFVTMICIIFLIAFFARLATTDGSKYCDISSFSKSGADVSSLLQTCIDLTDSGDTLTIPAGLFSLSTGIVINRPITVISEALSEFCSVDNPAACPIFQARPDFYHPSAIITVFNTSNVWLERLVVDGNRLNRLQSTAATECSNDVNNRYVLYVCAMDGWMDGCIYMCVGSL